jgi:hypothetical protein
VNGWIRELNVAPGSPPGATIHQVTHTQID